MQILPYLNFDGRCEEAVEFYQKSLGAEVIVLMRFKDSPQPHAPGMLPPGAESKVMHASFRIGQSILMATDARCEGKSTFGGISLSLSTASDAEAQKVFAALADGGEVRMPLTKTFFSSLFGIVGDRFGVNWMITVNT